MTGAMSESEDSVIHRLLVYFGLAWREGGEPRGKKKRSRYAAGASARLDEDIDELRSRIAALERDRF
jgi:hypothetical protein